MQEILNSKQKLEIRHLKSILTSKASLKLDADDIINIDKCRNYLDEKTKNSDDAFYGINTGFGSLYKIKIDDKDLEKLQENLVISHACGIGEEVPIEIVRIMLLLKVRSLSYGHSGIKKETVERLLYFFNHHIYPIIYQQGSLGASGDLAPLAHLALPLIGHGELFYNGNRISAEDFYKQTELDILKLKSKEGLALLNGTQFMSAYGTYALMKAQHLFNVANIITAISLEAINGNTDAFDGLVQKIRPHAGQKAVAQHFSFLLHGSDINTAKKNRVQDPYSFRCVPQVHGASYDVMQYALQIFETEINSVTDNPLIFPDEDRIISGGNFHGQPLALALDHLALAMHELGSISERRTYQLISGLDDLPKFLVKNAGLNSGFMIPQYTAASIVSQNKQLCTPASADSIVSSDMQEDHVSMGANAATKCYQVLQNLERILAIELFTASQAVQLKPASKKSEAISKVLKDFSKLIPFVENDKLMYKEIEASVQFIKTYKFPELDLK
jgi:histidine ammonia-lyase